MSHKYLSAEDAKKLQDGTAKIMEAVAGIRDPGPDYYPVEGTEPDFTIRSVELTACYSPDRFSGSYGHEAPNAGGFELRCYTNASTHPMTIMFYRDSDNKLRYDDENGTVTKEFLKTVLDKLIEDMEPTS